MFDTHGTQLGEEAGATFVGVFEALWPEEQTGEGIAQESRDVALHSKHALVPTSPLGGHSLL